MKISLYEPYLNINSIKYVNEALGNVELSRGKFINLAEERISEILDVKYTLLCSNGTCANHLLAKVLIKNNIKKLIVPNNVYVAAWNPFLFDNKIKLITVDADLNTWNADLKNFNYKNCAVLIVHNLGNIINVPDFKKNNPTITIIEDNCEGFMGKYYNKQSGTSALASSISFFGNKIITSGEGGAFITNDFDVFEYAKCIHGQGQSDVRYVHNLLGYNYRITNVQAAILLGQLDIIDEILEKKQIIFKKYRDGLSCLDSVKFQEIESNTTHSSWMFGVRFLGKEYDEIKSFFDKKNIEIRPMFYPISAHKHLKNNDKVKINSCKNAKILNKECILIPSYPGLSNEQVNYILRSIYEFIKIK